MAVSNTTTSTTYQGDGSTVSFPITAAIQANSQVKVSKLNTVTDVSEDLIVGTHYTHPAADPGVSILMVTAPTADEQLTVYRETPKTQTIDYIGSGAFLAESHEAGMDRMVMMIQELELAIANIPVSEPLGSGPLVRLADQSLGAVGTITLGANQRMLKGVKSSGGALTASTSTPIQDGTIDGQEITLEGLSDTDTLTISDQGNVDIGGDITFYDGTVLGCYWNATRSKWMSNYRKD